MERKRLFIWILCLILALGTVACHKEAVEAETDFDFPLETGGATKPEERLEEGGAVMKLYEENSGSRAILYAAPDHSFLGDAYGVELSFDGEHWYPLDVWTAKVAVQITQGVYENYVTNFVNFDFEGQVFLRVTPKTHGKVEIRPVGKSKSAQSGDATVIRLDKPCQLSFEVNGNIYENLQIFANPIEEIDQNDPNVIYLGPGVHTADNCAWIENKPATENGERVYCPELWVPSGKTLYISGSAVVQAKVVVSKCENTAVKGRGVIDLLPWNRENNIRASETKASPNGFRIDNSKNITLEGVIVRNSLGYSIHAGNVKGLVVDNIKAIAAAQWSDGFDCMATEDVVIKNCFFRTNDDCIAVYGSRWAYKGGSRNIEVYDCVLWADNAHAINMGNHGSNDPQNSDVIENIHFHDIEVLEVHSINWTGMFSIMCGGENILRNVTAERFNVEFTKSDLIRFRFAKDADHYGTAIENFTFRDIYFTPREGQTVGVYLQGLNDERAIRNVHFDNVWIGDEKLKESSDLLHCNEYVSEITFK